MTDPVLVALISAAGGAVSGAFGKTGFDRWRKPFEHGNGNGSAVEKAIAKRADIEFQTRITLLLGQLTAAIEKGHDKAIGQMETVGAAINQAAAAVREVHAEIVTHSENVKPAIEIVFDTNRLVQDLRRRVS